MSWSEQGDRSAAKLGALLVKADLVGSGDMHSILRDIQGLNADLPFILHKRGLVDETTVARTISTVFQLPFLDQVSTATVLTDLYEISLNDMESYRILPMEYDHSSSIPRIKVVMSNPFNLLHCQHLSSQATLEIVVGTSSTIKDALSAIVIEQDQEPIEKRVLSQLVSSGMVTSAQIDFAKSVVLRQHRKPFVHSGSKSETPSELT